MKRLITITIVLCLVISSVLPVYAASEVNVVDFWDPNTATRTNSKTWADAVTSALSTISTRIYNVYTRIDTTNTRLNTIITALTDNSNSYILSNMLIQIQKLTHIADQFDFFLGSDGTTTITENWSEFTEDIYNLTRFLAPVSSSLPGVGNSFMTLWDYTFFVAGRVADLWGGWDNYFSHLPILATINDRLNTVRIGVANVYRANSEMSLVERQTNAHQSLVDEYGRYDIPRFAADGSPNQENFSFKWNYGSPLGNLALITRYSIGQTNSLLSKAVTRFNDQLTTWEHDTHTQTTFTPVSMVNGLYRYLAYIQSDTADMDYNLSGALMNYFSGNTAWTTVMKQRNAHSYLLDNNGYYTMAYYNSHGMPGSQGENILWSNGTPIGNLAVIMRYGQQQTNKLLSFLVGNFDSTQTITSWLTASNQGVLATASYTPESAIDGIYKYLSNIQEPLARLTYVHADSNDIILKKQEEANETVVRNNFFGSGGAAASASDFGDISSAVVSFKSNANTGASASGVWSVFDQSNYNWFSQTTANNLDTTNNYRKSSEEYSTPLLDSYYEYMTDYLKEN